jgi:hypothetical protein
MPEDTPAEIAEKRRRFEAARADPSSYALGAAADLYIAAFLIPKNGEVPTIVENGVIPTTGHVWSALLGQQVNRLVVRLAVEVSRKARAFHWPLEFPDVMAAGGFDVVLGNPPWEVIQLGEEEYFGQRLPEVAELAGSARKKAIAALEAERPRVFAEYQADKRRFEAANEFVRASGRFDLTARGKVNTYALFAELFVVLVSPSGRAGVIVPTGLATADTTKYFFDHLITAKHLISFFNFFEIRQWFVATDDRNPFGLLTMGAYAKSAELAFFLTDTRQLTDSERRFTLSADQIAQINPNTKTSPIFRSRTDAEWTAKIHARIPVLIDESKGAAGNPWGVEFRQGLFNMTSDSGLFRTAGQLDAAGFVRKGSDWIEPEGLAPRQRALDMIGGGDRRSFDLKGGAGRRTARYLALYEAKMIHQYDHRWATYDGEDSRDTTSDEMRDPSFEPTPRYWVPEVEVAGRIAAKHWTRQWLMGWRDICRSTDERTVIATAFPRAGVNHKMPLFMTNERPELAVAMLSNWLSLTLDYVARQKLGGTSLTYFYLKQLPVLPPSAYREADLGFITQRVLELTYTSHLMAPFACDLGYDGPPFCWDNERRAQLRAELDAWYARAYGLSRDELRYILDPAEVKGPDYPSETFRVLKKNELSHFGEYRTARLVLAAWDRFERDGTFGARQAA